MNQLFTLINKTTGKPLRLTYTNETMGRAYMTYERPVFSVEDESEYSTNDPIFMTPSKEIAEQIIQGKFDGEDSITKPYLTQGWADGEKCEYIVKEIKL